MLQTGRILQEARYINALFDTGAAIITMSLVGILLLVTSVPVSVVGPAGQDSKKDYLVWQARKELADLILTPVQHRLGDIEDGNQFVAKHVEQQIKKLPNQDRELASGTATEPEQLYAMFEAYGDLVNLLIRVRDVAKPRMAAQQRKEQKKESQPVFRPPRRP